jgi:hypothetical protein
VSGRGHHSTARVCRLPWGGQQTGKDPTNRGKLGTKRHLVVDRTGLPLAITITGANVHDSRALEEAVDAVPTLRLPSKRRGRPRKHPHKRQADKGGNVRICVAGGRDYCWQLPCLWPSPVLQ